MYVLVIKPENAVQIVCPNISSNERFWIIEGNSYYKDCFDAFEIDGIPSDVEPIKWCYTQEDGFYPNPNYREPSAYDLAPQEVVNAIIDEYTNELIEMGVL